MKNVFRKNQLFSFLLGIGLMSSLAFSPQQAMGQEDYCSPCIQISSDIGMVYECYYSSLEATLGLAASQPGCSGIQYLIIQHSDHGGWHVVAMPTITYRSSDAKDLKPLTKEEIKKEVPELANYKPFAGSQSCTIELDGKALELKGNDLALCLGRCDNPQQWDIVPAPNVKSVFMIRSSGDDAKLICWDPDKGVSVVPTSKNAAERAPTGKTDECTLWQVVPASFKDGKAASYRIVPKAASQMAIVANKKTGAVSVKSTAKDQAERSSTAAFNPKNESLSWVVGSCDVVYDPIDPNNPIGEHCVFFDDMPLVVTDDVKNPVKLCMKDCDEPQRWKVSSVGKDEYLIAPVTKKAQLLCWNEKQGISLQPTKKNATERAVEPCTKWKIKKEIVNDGKDVQYVIEPATAKAHALTIDKKTGAVSVKSNAKTSAERSSASMVTTWAFRTCIAPPKKERAKRSLKKESKY